MKFFTPVYNQKAVAVALFTRAWIEISVPIPLRPLATVALFTRAWIEIERIRLMERLLSRRPLHEGVD